MGKCKNGHSSGTVPVYDTGAWKYGFFSVLNPGLLHNFFT